MNDVIKKISALRGDEKRQAVDSLRGYFYQLYQSINAWLDLENDELLYLEGAEDFDIVSASEAKAVQVKHSGKIITLRSKDAKSAISNFWDLKNKNPNTRIIYHLLTTSTPGVEKGNPFGEGISGIDYWNICKKDLESVGILKEFLSQFEELPKKLINFLKSADNLSIQNDLIQPIVWDVESQQITQIQKTIEGKLILLGENFGIPPTEAVAALDNLLDEVIEKILSKQNRVLNKVSLLHVFEESTMISVSSRSIRPLIDKMSLPPDSMLDQLLVAKSPALVIASSNVTQMPLPKKNLAPREELVRRLIDYIGRSKFIILTGSSGVGKSTTAKFIAQTMTNEWDWLSFTSISPDKVTSQLINISRQLTEKSDPFNIVLDDIKFSAGHFRNYGDYMAIFLDENLGQNGHIIVTCQSPPDEVMLNKLGIAKECIYKIPHFDEKEIIQYALQLGCPDQDQAKFYASLTLSQTGGHPLLTHARLIAISSKSWPKISIDDILTTPKEIEDVQRHTRQLLLEELTAHQIELTYRLSIILGPIRRDHVERIGDISPEIPLASEIFEQLIGPWFEALTDEYFRISSLLINAASKVWSKEKIKLLQAEVGRAILNSGNLTLNEAQRIFQLSFIAGDTQTLSIIISTLIRAPEDNSDLIAHEFDWIIGIGTKPEKIVLPDDPVANFLFRIFQFRIARKIDIELASQLAKIIDNEITPFEPAKLYSLQRFMLATTILSTTEVAIPPKLIIKLLYEVFELQKQLTDELSKMVSADKEEVFMNTFDGIVTLFSFTIFRLDGISFYQELFQEVDNLPTEFRDKLLKEFTKQEPLVDNLIDTVWLREGEKETPDWDNCIVAFKQTMEMALNQNLPLLAYSASRGIATVYQEYLHDDVQALNILDEIVKKLPPSLSIDDARATILLNIGKYEEAVKIWEKILPKWNPPLSDVNIRPIFSCRNAGIASAKLNNFKKASEFFIEGSERSDSLNFPDFAAEYLADASFELWSAGEVKGSIKMYERTLQKIEKLPDPSTSLSSFILNKLIGQSLLWISDSISIVPDKTLNPPAHGMCSNPDKHESFRELPETPIDISWLSLAQIEYFDHSGTSIFSKISERLKHSDIPLVVVFHAGLDLKISISSLNTMDLPTKVITYLDAIIETKKSYQSDYEKSAVLKESEVNNSEVESKSIFPVLYFVFAIIFQADSGDLKLEILLNNWRECVKGTLYETEVTEWAGHAESIFLLKISEAVGIMKNTSEDDDNRILTALRLGIDETTNPEDLFYSHVILTEYILSNQVGMNLSHPLASIFSKQWILRTQNPALLRTPKLTVPAIMDTCQGNLNSRGKAAQILLAVNDAVSTTLPPEILDRLRKLAEAKG